MPYRMTPSVRHRVIEVHYYYYYPIFYLFNTDTNTVPNMNSGTDVGHGHRHGHGNWHGHQHGLRNDHGHEHGQEYGHDNGHGTDMVTNTETHIDTDKETGMEKTGMISKGSTCRVDKTVWKCNRCRKTQFNICIFV